MLWWAVVSFSENFAKKKPTFFFSKLPAQAAGSDYSLITIEDFIHRRKGLNQIVQYNNK